MWKLAEQVHVPEQGNEMHGAMTLRMRQVLQIEMEANAVAPRVTFLAQSWTYAECLVSLIWAEAQP